MRNLPCLFLMVVLAVPIHAENAKDTGPAEIRAALTDQQAAWNRGDLDAFMAGYWNSPDLTFFSGGQ